MIDVDSQTAALPSLIVIVGPTGSGKSALALHVAEKFSGEIVNCDSLQLYRGFNIGTAKVPASDRRNIPHHLMDVIEPKNGYSAGDYARDARRVIEEIAARGHLPVVVGGTGFYLRALLEGLPELPTRDEQLRARLSGMETKRPGSLHRLLKRLEPSAAQRIHANDTQKILRAAEARILIRSALPSLDAGKPIRGFRILKIGLAPDRSALRDTLDARATKMFQCGLIDEVCALLMSGLCGEEKPFESLGYKQALAYLRGAMTLDEAITSTQAATRQYAKRQGTWFRKDPQIQWLSGFGNSPSVIEQCIDLIRHFQ